MQSKLLTLSGPEQDKVCIVDFPYTVDDQLIHARFHVLDNQVPLAPLADALALDRVTFLGRLKAGEYPVEKLTVPGMRGVATTTIHVAYLEAALALLNPNRVKYKDRLLHFRGHLVAAIKARTLYKGVDLRPDQPLSEAIVAAIESSTIHIDHPLDHRDLLLKTLTKIMSPMLANYVMNKNELVYYDQDHTPIFDADGRLVGSKPASGYRKRRLPNLDQQDPAYVGRYAVAHKRALNVQQADEMGIAPIPVYMEPARWEHDLKDLPRDGTPVPTSSLELVYRPAVFIGAPWNKTVIFQGVPPLTDNSPPATTDD